MALRDSIEVTRDRALSMLNEAHDYFFYTQRAWRILQSAVQHDGLKFSLRNASTKSKVSEEDLIARAQRYAAQELPSGTLLQFVSIFEAFLFDVLRHWLLTYPQSLSSRQLSGREIFSLPDKAGTSARVKIGHPLDLPESYHQASWELIRKLIRDIGDALASKAHTS